MVKYLLKNEYYIDTLRRIKAKPTNFNYNLFNKSILLLND